MAHPISLDAILRATAICARLSVDDMLVSDRRDEVVRPRQRAMLLARRIRPELSLPFVAGRMGYGDHTSVLHGARRALRRIDAGETDEIELVAATLRQLGLSQLPPPPSYTLARSHRAIQRDLVIARQQVAALEAELASLPEFA